MLVSKSCAHEIISYVGRYLFYNIVIIFPLCSASDVQAQFMPFSWQGSTINRKQCSLMNKVNSGKKNIQRHIFGHAERLQNSKQRPYNILKDYMAFLHGLQGF